MPIVQWNARINFEINVSWLPSLFQNLWAKIMYLLLCILSPSYLLSVVDWCMKWLIFLICCECGSWTPMRAAIASPWLRLVLLMNLVSTNLMNPLCDLQTIVDVLPSFLAATSNQRLLKTYLLVKVGSIWEWFHQSSKPKLCNVLCSSLWSFGRTARWIELWYCGLFDF